MTTCIEARPIKTPLKQSHGSEMKKNKRACSSRRARSSKRTRQNKLSQLRFESLEQRQLLAVDGFQIDLTQNLDLFLGPSGGAAVQAEFANATKDGAIDGVVGDQVFPSVQAFVNEDDGRTDITPQLLSDDASAGDAESSEETDIDSTPSTIVDFSAPAGAGVFSLDADGTLTFDPNGDFETLRDGETRELPITFFVDEGTGTVSYTHLTLPTICSV